MKDSKHKILTLAALTTIAAGVIHLTNRVIVASSQLKEMLDFSNHNYYNWRFGKIYYTKKGKGSPLLLIHDTMPGASGYEWSRVEDQQKWKKMMLVNIAKAGFFSSDRTIAEYNRDIWKLK